MSTLLPSLITTSRQLVSAVGMTQASSVMPVVKSSALESGTVTQLLVPLNDSAPPNFPVVTRVAPLIVPTFPVPELSTTLAPLVSSKPYDATKPLAIITRGSSASNCIQSSTAFRNFALVLPSMSLSLALPVHPLRHSNADFSG